MDFQPGLTLRKAISLAGGFTERANKKQALVISDSDPERKEQKVGWSTRYSPATLLPCRTRSFNE